MSLAMLGLQVALAFGLDGGRSPVTEAFAYSRETTPGIPTGPGVEASAGRSLETTYFIYVVLRKDSVPTEAAVSLKGKLYAASLQKVASPVTIDHDPAVPTGQKDTLVPATPSPVYQVLPADEKRDGPPDEGDTRLVQDNEVVVFIRAEGTSWRVPIKAARPLPPAPGR